MHQITNSPRDLSEIPRIANISFQPLAPNYPLLSALESLIFWLIPTIALFGIKIFKPQAEIPQLVFFVFPVITILSVVISFLGAKAKGFVLREKDILYKQGLFWQKQTGVSFKRIQHIDISNGPMERKFGLSTIKFFTAGGALADLKISGLTTEDAQKLRSFILEKIGLVEDGE
ncbi:MAG: PH domain-containing protein [Kangiellaceae bacterium]|nr:PH domain-containing protein [Kangiellaceae bacterium]MCW8999467.1 PH domain-containing protein [Kangiellaceae bacterium]MCW9015324.1 PH domain-containing protein [Kangiellaceae bacterium]